MRNPSMNNKITFLGWFLILNVRFNSQGFHRKYIFKRQGSINDLEDTAVEYENGSDHINYVKSSLILFDKGTLSENVYTTTELPNAVTSEKPFINRTNSNVINGANLNDNIFENEELDFDILDEKNSKRDEEDIESFSPENDFTPIVFTDTINKNEKGKKIKYISPLNYENENEKNSDVITTNYMKEKTTLSLTNNNLSKFEKKNEQVEAKDIVNKTVFSESENQSKYNNLEEYSEIMNELTLLLTDVTDQLNTTGSNIPKVEYKSSINTSGQANKTLFEVLQDLNLNILLNYLELANMSDILERTGPFTIFAPTDKAFEALPKFITIGFKKNPERLRQILEYHIISKTIYSVNLKNELLIETLYSNKTLRINRYGNNLITNQFIVDGANLIYLDNNASNGVVHIINRVLYRIPQYSIKQALAKTKKFATLNKIVKMSALENLLSDAAGPFTLFAPTEAAFKKSLLGNIFSWNSDVNFLQDIIKYHIVPGTYFKAELQEETLIPSWLGESLFISTSHNHLKVNNASILDSDLPMTNGVIHAIDTVLKPPYYKSARKVFL